MPAFILWIYRQADRYTGLLGEEVSLADILVEPEDLASIRPVLLEQRLFNDEATRRFTNGSLATVRVVTGRWASGKIEVFGAVLKMPVAIPSWTISEEATRSLRSTSRRARWRPASSTPTNSTPSNVTLIPASGSPVPQCRNGAISSLWHCAHACIDEYVLLAFDIAPTPAGPVLVEANGRGDTRMLQYMGAPPLGHTVFPAIVLSDLDSRVSV